ncbi:DNA-binding protein [Listeria monocytogenes]|uniref:DNA-binding protein n=1 Tax=Lactococcus lactis TaxID=1358 RepID=UPI0010B46F16|nr:DNA-binding protein [Listeria monocytogenes]EAG6807451.1 DNA-binding protein [Listeria monocytogenes]EAK8416078.1 DNA-binding protein [Listeria monocytogenes]HAA7227409.1 DNA-binding protein [Listeria monocytogenes]
MSEKLKTIKELADELGVSKKKIHYQVSKLDSDLIQKLDGTIYLDNRAITAIKENIGYVSKTKLDSGAIQNRQHLDSELDTQNTKLIHEKSEQINYLKEQIKNKDNQISVKDEQIKSLVEAQKQIQNLLDQQQRLALQDKKLLEEYKAENDNLKALKMPTQDTKVEQVSSKQPQEVESVAEEPKKAPRKWWKIW